MDERQTALDRIRAYRATLLQRLEYELVRFRCRATVADVQKFIYEREEGRPVSEYISQPPLALGSTGAQIPIGRPGGPRFSATEFLRRLTYERSSRKLSTSAS